MEEFAESGGRRTGGGVADFGWSLLRKCGTSYNQNQRDGKESQSAHSPTPFFRAPRPTAVVSGCPQAFCLTQRYQKSCPEAPFSFRRRRWRGGEPGRRRERPAWRRAWAAGRADSRQRGRRRRIAAFAEEMGEPVGGRRRLLAAHFGGLAARDEIFLHGLRAAGVGQFAGFRINHLGYYAGRRVEIRGHSCIAAGPWRVS